MDIFSNAIWLLSILLWQWSLVKIILVLPNRVWNKVKKKNIPHGDNTLVVFLTLIVTTGIIVFTLPQFFSEIFSQKVDLYALFSNILTFAPFSILIWFVIEFLLTIVSLVLHLKQKDDRNNLIKHLFVNFIQATIIGGIFFAVNMIFKIGFYLTGSMAECLYKNEKYYFKTSVPCCDQLKLLYRADGSYFCSPSGGFTGGGDGRCPEDLREKIQCKNAFGIYTHLNEYDF